MSDYMSGHDATAKLKLVRMPTNLIKLLLVVINY
jgi:hypothetical protein